MLIMSTINLSLHIVKTQKKMRRDELIIIKGAIQFKPLMIPKVLKIISLASFSLYQLANLEDRVHCWWYELQGTYSKLDNVYLNVIVGLMLFIYYIHLYFCFQVLLCIIRALWDVKRINMKYLFFISSLIYWFIHSFIYLFLFHQQDLNVQNIRYNV